MQAAACRSGDLDQAALDRHVDVLVVGAELERALLQLRRHALEAAVDRLRVLVGQDAALGQHRRVGPGLGDVLARQPPVEADRGVEALEDRVGRIAKASHSRQFRAGPRPSRMIDAQGP